MSLLGPDRLLVGRSVVDRKEARCIHCMQPIKFGPKGEPGVVHSREGMKEMGISGMCETCFDNLSGEPDDGTFLEFKRSADEDEPCPCAGGTATCRGNCPIFDKVAKQDAAQPSQAPVVQAVQTEVRFKYESMKPIDGYDAIYAEYSTTFGRYPDDFMSKVVRQTKEDLFMWWGAHREKIRAGLVLLAAQEDASSGATTPAAPFAKDSWQHAVDNQLVAFGRTSQEFANPHEALAWLAIMNMELGQSNAGATTQAVRMRMLTEVEKLPFICPRCKVDRFKEACPGPLESCPVRFDAHAGRTIPPSGEIGGA